MARPWAGERRKGRARRAGESRRRRDSSTSRGHGDTFSHAFLPSFSASDGFDAATRANADTPKETALLCARLDAEKGNEKKQASVAPLFFLLLRNELLLSAFYIDHDACDMSLPAAPSFLPIALVSSHTRALKHTPCFLPHRKSRARQRRPRRRRPPPQAARAAAARACARRGLRSQATLPPGDAPRPHCRSIGPADLTLSLTPFFLSASLSRFLSLSRISPSKSACCGGHSAQLSSSASPASFYSGGYAIDDERDHE